MRRPRFTLQLLAAAALAVPLLASADPRYSVTVVAGADSRASNLNNAGQVVGWLPAGDQYHGFVYGSGVLTDIGTLGASGSVAYGINDLGQVVGNLIDANRGEYNGFLYSGGTMTALTGATSMRANGINNSGTIVGSMWVDNPDGGDVHPYTLSSGGTLTDLGALPGGDGGYAYAINSHGDVVGEAFSAVNGAPNYPTDPFIYHDGVMTGLGNLGGPWSAAYSINDHGQVVGYLGMAADAIPGQLYPYTAFLYENGQMHPIGSLSPAWSSLALDINNRGQVVGIAGPNGGQGHAFLYENGAMTDLDTLIDPASGWTIREAAAINDLQQIAATACRAGVCQAVRLDLVPAVPEPPVFALMAAGLALGLARGKGFRLPVRRRRG